MAAATAASPSSAAATAAGAGIGVLVDSLTLRDDGRCQEDGGHGSHLAGDADGGSAFGPGFLLGPSAAGGQPEVDEDAEHHGDEGVGDVLHRPGDAAAPVLGLDLGEDLVGAFIVIPVGSGTIHVVGDGPGVRLADRGKGGLGGEDVELPVIHVDEEQGSRLAAVPPPGVVRRPGGGGAGGVSGGHQACAGIVQDPGVIGSEAFRLLCAQQARLVIDEDNYRKDVVNDLRDGGVGVISAESNGLMHAKYIIIDGKVVISGSANMTLASFSYDNNFMIRMESEEAAAVFTAEFEEMYSDCLFGENSPSSKAAPSVKLDDGTTVYVRFSPDDGIDDMIESLIAAANESVYMLAYSFASRDIAERLEAADDDGLDVIVVCEDSKAYTDGGGQCGPLSEAGLQVYVDGSEDALMHEKVIILDNKVVIAGSYNFTRSADKRNDEQVLVISGGDVADQFLAEFDKILAEAR